MLSRVIAVLPGNGEDVSTFFKREVPAGGDIVNLTLFDFILLWCSYSVLALGRFPMRFLSVHVNGYILPYTEQGGC